MSMPNGTDVALAAPPAGIAALKLGGVTLSEWVIILNLIYITLVLSLWVYKQIKEFRNGRK
jgi:hypothetical protein